MLHALPKIRHSSRSHNTPYTHYPNYPTRTHPVSMPQKPFLTAEWRDIAMVNFEIDPDVISPYVPSGTEIDLWHNRCYVSVVGFRFLKTRVMGMMIPLQEEWGMTPCVAVMALTTSPAGLEMIPCSED